MHTYRWICLLLLLLAFDLFLGLSLREIRICEIFGEYAVMRIQCTTNIIQINLNFEFNNLQQQLEREQYIQRYLASPLKSTVLTHTFTILLFVVLKKGKKRAQTYMYLNLNTQLSGSSFH